VTGDVSGFFEAAPGGGSRIELDELERSILRSLTVQLMEMIGPDDGPEDPDEDPLARLFREGPSEAPKDPALARLFPDAYGADDSEAIAASSEFRRYTEPDLRQRKRDDALGLVRELDSATPAADGSVAVVLDAAAARQWLGTLNDLRLTLGTRLDVSEDDSRVYRMPDSDPEKPLMMAYLWLGGLQETLVETLMR
jgi:hypothetical protein